MTWASRDLAEEAPEVAPEIGPGGGGGAEEVVRRPEAGALQVNACLVPTSSQKVHLSEAVLAEQNAQECRRGGGGGSQPWDMGILQVGTRHMSFQWLAACMTGVPRSRGGPRIWGSAGASMLELHCVPLREGPSSLARAAALCGSLASMHRCFLLNYALSYRAKRMRTAAQF